MAIRVDVVAIPWDHLFLLCTFFDRNWEVPSLTHKQWMPRHPPTFILRLVLMCWIIQWCPWRKCHLERLLDFVRLHGCPLLLAKRMISVLNLKGTMIKQKGFVFAKTPWMYRKHFVKNHQVLTVTYFQHIQIITMKHQSSMQPPLSTLSHHHPIVGWALLDIGYLQALTPEPKRRSRQDWFLAGATRGGNGAWREHQIEQGVTKKQ